MFLVIFKVEHVSNVSGHDKIFHSWTNKVIDFKYVQATE